MRKAFTLLEILLATGIFMTVLVGAVGIFTSTISSSSTTGSLRNTAQAARFAFESITRESRLSKGLVFTDGPNSQPVFIVPPFEIRQSADPMVVIYKARVTGASSQDQSLYSIECRIYFMRDNQLKLQVYIAQGAGEGLTAASLHNALKPKDQNGQWSQDDEGERCQPLTVDPPASSFWQQQSDNPVLPSDARLVKLRFPTYRNYPYSPDDLTYQPFIQVVMTLESQAAVSSSDGRHVRTTLQTMIVPREFATRYEVAQEGIQRSGSNQ